jgi:predicted membrane protein (TIGR00267 family)
MIGMLTGFYSAGIEDPAFALSGCLGAAIALFMSGVSSAYLSEKAEREKELKELENALVKSLRQSDYGQASILIPCLVALVNGFSPFLLSLIITSPLVCAKVGMIPSATAIPLSIGVGCICLFSLGVYLGKISQKSLLWAGFRTLMISFVTIATIFFFSYTFSP